MGSFQLTNQERLNAYLTRNHCTVLQRLGFGKDGTVWQTDRFTAVKVFDRDWAYEQELRVYERLRERGVTKIRGHAVPLATAWDATLGVIELSIVSPPFVLDFASAQLDQAPDFPPEVMQDWLNKKRAEFGPNAPAMLGILAALRAVGVHMLDVHPGNIRFGNEHLLPDTDSDSSSS